MSDKSEETSDAQGGSGCLGGFIVLILIIYCLFWYRDSIPFLSYNDAIRIEVKNEVMPFGVQNDVIRVEADGYLEGTINNTGDKHCTSVYFTIIFTDNEGLEIETRPVFEKDIRAKAKRVFRVAIPAFSVKYEFIGIVVRTKWLTSSD
ncbi:MAG: hypothetical protein P9L92_03415 [Candidatus Electryonea clarkiae]|nr:hypothetical protein [Candidatus Electryonea clarkiae]MDP8286795.1 hypothetical protein [Candidatus Electryonea clarkiae]